MPITNKVRVLIVEDLEDYRNRFVNAIKNSTSCEVVGVAKNGAEGLRLVDNTLYDVLLSDIGLPDISGLEVMASSSVKRPYARILVMSQFYDKVSFEGAIQAGAQGYIQKDEMPANIVDIILDTHAGASNISPAIATLLMKMERERLIARPSTKNPLSPVRTQILSLLAANHGRKRVAQYMGMSEDNVNYHCKEIYKTLNVSTALAAANMGDKHGWLIDITELVKQSAKKTIALVKQL